MTRTVGGPKERRGRFDLHDRLADAHRNGRVDREVWAELRLLADLDVQVVVVGGLQQRELAGVLKFQAEAAEARQVGIAE